MKTKINISNLSWTYLVDYDSNISYHCDEGCDPYCRCGVVDPVVNSINYDSVYRDIFRILKKSKISLSDIKLYCLDRMIRNVIKVIDINAYGISGYYGQEVACKLNSDAEYKLTSLIEDLINKRGRTAIETVLELEYGYVLDELKKKDWEIKTVDISQIHPSYTEVSSNIVSTYSGKETILCQTINEDHYRLIDGNHRFVAAKQNNLKKMSILTTKI